MAIALHATIDHFPTLSHKEAPSMNSAIMATGTSSIKMSAQLLKKSTSQWPSSSDKGPKKKGWELGSNGISRGYDESRQTTIAPTNRHFATIAKKPKQTTERQQTYCLGGK